MSHPPPDSRPGLLREALGSAAFALVPAAAFAALVFGLLTRPLPWTWTVPWVPGAGVQLSLRVDGLSALMLLLVTGVGVAVFVYAAGYLAHDRRRVRVLALLTAFLLAMIGAVTADDAVLLFLFWEATSVLSFLLVGTDHEDEAARKSAQQALLVTGGGGLFLLAGLLLLGQLAGTYSLSGIVARGPSLLHEPLLYPALGAVLVGCATKSAQFPFHFWLPDAMSAPTPASAYLHSATMVKLGVYLLARLDAGFGDWLPWDLALVPMGAFTAAWAMVLSLRERDLKRILAWSTVGALGTLVMLVGLQGDAATVAAASFLVAHALYKAPLFFVAGNVDHGTGTRVLDRLGGLGRRMPFTAAAAALAGLSMAGLPLSFGYLAKDVIVAAKQDTETLRLLVTVAQSYKFVGAVAVAVAAVAAVRIFWRHPGPCDSCPAHEGNAAMVVPPLVLAATGIVLGLAPGLVEPLLAAAARAMTPGEGGPPVDLGLSWSPLLLTAGTTAGVGLGIYLAWDPLHRVLARLDPLDRWGAAALFRAGLEGMRRVAAGLTRTLQHGRLPAYLAVLLGAAVLGTGALALQGGLVFPEASSPGLPVAFAAAVVAAGALLACGLSHRLVLLLASGLVGYGSALLFLFTGAPDLALTQFAVESAFVVVAASLLLWLRRAGAARSLPEPRLRPGALALGLVVGLGLAGLVLAVAAGPQDPALRDFFTAQAFPAAQGRNVVNVIIVDFRGLDTLGEVAVVAFSLLAALPLLTALRAGRAS